MRLKKQKCIILFALFLLFLAYFTSTYKFYVPAKLIVETTSTEQSDAHFYWDSGYGFHDKESFKFLPFVEKNFENRPHRVEITKLKEANLASSGNEVAIASVMLDESRSYNLLDLVKPGESLMKNGELVLSNTNSLIMLNESFEKITISFHNHRWAGKVNVSIDGKSQLIDLFSDQSEIVSTVFNDGIVDANVTREFSLPQIRLNAFRFDLGKNAELKSLKVVSEKGIVNIPVPERKNSSYLINNLDLGTAQFNYLLFIIQAIVAFLLTWLLYELWSYIEKVNIHNGKEIFKYIFLYKGHPVFWSMFIFSFLIFLLWLLGQWPGIMTVDSYHFTWREVKTLQFTNVTPWMFNLYVLAILQFRDSPASIALFHLFSSSLIGSYIFYFTYKQGANRWLIFICYMLFVFSVPVGIYNITLWKDIPFNFIMLFWGFFIYYIYLKKKYLNEDISFPLPRIIVLSLLLVLLTTLRHNGIIFLVLTPLILIKFQLLNRKNLYQFVAITSAFYIFTLLLTPVIANKIPNGINDFFAATYRVGPLAAIYSSKDYYSPTYEKDKSLINKWLTEDELKAKYAPISLAGDIGYMVDKWMRLSAEEQRQLNHLYYMRSIQNLHIFMADRFTMFIGTMGFAKNNAITYNNLEDSDKSLWRPIESYRLSFSPKVKSLYNYEKKILSKALSFNGEIPIVMLVFNTLPPLLVLMTSLLLYKQYPASALYSFYFLYNIPFLFIVLSTCEWRYLYFLLLSSYFIIPMVSLESHMRNKQ